MLAERHRAQVDRVAAAHSLRVLLVVVSIPVAYQWLGVHGALVAGGVVQAVQGVRPRGLLLMALASAPFTAAGAYDFSGLRQKLEGIRHKTPRAAVVHVTLRSGVALTTIAKLLGYVMRNSSGRTLFGTVRLAVADEPAPAP